LDVRDLEVVLALAEAGSTVRAAAVLHLTQSAVSRGLSLAEEKLGLAIFRRGAHGLVPTAAGKRLILGAPALLGQWVELEARVAAPASEPLRVRLACECYTAYRWLPSTLASLHQTSPSMDVSIALEHTHGPVPALLSGALDIALLTTSAVRSPLVERALFSDEIVFVVAASHPLAARPHITRAQLSEYPLIASTQTPKPEAAWFTKAVFGRSRPKLDYLRLPLTEAIIDAARAGMGIAVLSEWIAGPYLESAGLVAKRLQGRVIRRPWRIAYRREAAEAALRLGALLERAAPRVYPS
jgi:LysR family transcriptional regulator for metE and metH